MMDDTDRWLSQAIYPYRYPVVLRQSDGRGNGHVANGRIAMLGDDAREDMHFEIMGDRAAGRALHLVESRFRFLHEISFPGTLSIGVAVTAIGTSSLRETLGFFRDERCFVLSWLVVVKTANGRSVAFTADERARAAAYLVGG